MAQQPLSYSGAQKSPSALRWALELEGTRPLLLLRLDCRFENEKTAIVERLAKEAGQVDAVFVETRFENAAHTTIFPHVIRALIEKANGRLVHVPAHVKATLNYYTNTQDNLDTARRGVDRLALFEALRQLIGDVAQAGPVILCTAGPVAKDRDFVDFVDYLRAVGDSTVGLTEACSADMGLPTETNHVGRSSDRAIFRWVGLMTPETTLPAEWTGDKRFQHVPSAWDPVASVEAWLQSPALRERVVRITEGNPQYLQQLLQSLPVDMDDLVVRPTLALTGLAGEIRDVLVCAQKPLRLKHIAQWTGAGELLTGRTVNALRDAGFVCAAADRQQGVQWADPRSAVVVRGHVSAEKRRDIAAKLAEMAAEQWFLDGNEGDLQEAAGRYLEAGITDKAVEYGLEAADVVSRELRFRAAADLLEPLLRLPVDIGARREILWRLIQTSVALGEFGQAMGYVNQRLDGCEFIESEALRAELARVLVAGGEPERAVHVMVGATDWKTAAVFPISGTAVAVLADAYRTLGKVDEAIAVCAKYQGPLSAEVALAAGSAFYRRGAYAEAQRHYVTAAETADAPWEIVARAAHNLGLIALSKERYAEAARYLQRGIQLCETHGELRGAALGRYNLGITFEYMERFPLAERLLNTAVDTFRWSGQHPLLCSALVTLADLTLRVGEGRRAHRLAGRALELAETHRLEHGAASARQRLGLAESERGRFGRAAEWLSQAAAGFRGAKNGHDLCWTLVYLTETAVELGDMKGAYAALDELVESLVESGAELHAAATLCEAIVHHREARFLEAEHAAADAFDLFCQAGQREGQVRALLLQADVLATVNDLAKSAEIWKRAQSVLHELAGALPEAQRPRFMARRAFAGLVTAGSAEQSENVAKGRDPMPGVLETATASPQDGVTPRNSVQSVYSTAHPRIPTMLGTSPLLRQALDFATKVASSDMPVLVLGETGTGKELVAHGIVKTSHRADKPFLRVNVASFAENLLESELFGHEKGAFTGAVNRRQGAFELADGGTLFLDEIGDISPKMQVSLLRVLQEGEVIRVGGNHPIRVNVRVLCATNRDLDKMIRDGIFRLDLYHRICGFAVKLPPLRERNEDVLLLATEFLKRHNAESGRQVTLNGSAIQLLKKHGWPGNVRELEQVIRAAHLLAENATITAETLNRLMFSDEILSPTSTDRSSGGKASGSLDAATRTLEIEMIRRALEQSGGNITRAADLLCVKRPRLSLKIKEYGIFHPHSKEP